MKVSTLCTTAAALACSCVTASFRFDRARTLVDVELSFDQFVQQTDPGRSAFDRADFEQIDANRVQIWASEDHLALLSKSNVSWDKGTDHGAVSFAAEVNRSGGRYEDRSGAEPEWTEYCGYNCLTTRLADLAQERGCQFQYELIAIGKTTDGNSIWVAKIGSTGPKVLMAGNIHGDETVGGQVLQRWVWETCNQPTAQQEEVAQSMQAYYMPMFNPDGYEKNQRGNGKNQDLNRAFPTPTGTERPEQPEVVAYIAFAKSHEFDISMMYHGGAIVVNYAYDSCYTTKIVPLPCPPASTDMHPRHLQVIPSAEAYAVVLANGGVRCTVGKDCLVNGATWYQIEGSLQDWAFYFQNSLDMTMEISTTKRPASTTLPGFYEDNKAAIHNFMMYSVA
eukprot:m.411264 g.411264  ORF g.411264 m.411264 type:complete len:393 (-) comp28612_c0_seq1:779-1957(-)